MQFYCQKSIWPKKDTKLCLDVASVVGINFGNVKSSRILTFFDTSRRYFVSITFTAYVSEYSSYQWLPEGKNKIAYTFQFTMFVLLFFFGEYMYCIYRIISYQSFFLYIYNRHKQTSATHPEHLDAPVCCWGSCCSYLFQFLSICIVSVFVLFLFHSLATLFDLRFLVYSAVFLAFPYNIRPFQFVFLLLTFLFFFFIFYLKYIVLSRFGK